jgi:hypothetical protein
MLQIATEMQWALPQNLRLRVLWADAADAEVRLRVRAEWQWQWQARVGAGPR